MQNTTFNRIRRLISAKKAFDSSFSAIGHGIDIAELCGGVARATTLAVRRSLRAGPNFDLITGVDLNNRKDQDLTKKYIDKHHVLVVEMAPTCGPFGPMGRFVKYVTPDAWQRSNV